MGDVKALNTVSESVLCLCYEILFIGRIVSVVCVDVSGAFCDAKCSNW